MFGITLLKDSQKMCIIVSSKREAKIVLILSRGKPYYLSNLIVLLCFHHNNYSEQIWHWCMCAQKHQINANAEV